MKQQQTRYGGDGGAQERRSHQDGEDQLNNSLSVNDLTAEKGYMSASGASHQRSPPTTVMTPSSMRHSSKNSQYNSEEMERTSFMYNMEKSENQIYDMNEDSDDTDDDEENQQRRRHEDLGFHGGGDECEDGDDDCKRGRLFYYSTIRIVVVIVVIVLAALLSYLAYTFARGQEYVTFEAKFQDFADEIIRSSTNNARNSRVVLESFSRTVTSLAIFANTTWPLLTLPHYESRAYDYLTISKAESITFAPVVPTAHREQYENYTLHNQEWIQDGIDFEYLTHLQTKQQQESDEEYLLDNKEVTIEPTTIAPGTNMEGFSILNKAKPIQPFVWTHAEFTHRAEPDLGPGPYVPVWQTYPPPRNSYVVGNNLMGKGPETQTFQQLIETANHANTPTLSDIFDNNFFLFGNAQTIDVDPKSVILQPIFRKMLLPGGNRMRNNDIVAYMIVIKKWHQIFQDVLYKGAKPIIVVLRNGGDHCPNAKEFTYRVDGPDGRFLGKGDLHDTRYNDLEIMSPLFQASTIHSTGGCNYTLHVYPTKELEDDFTTDLPVIVLLTVLSFCAVLAAGAYVYDRMTQQHQRNRLKSIAQQEQALLRIDHARQAAASERQLNEFIAHEVRNPLSAAMSACSFVTSAVHELTTIMTQLDEQQDEPTTTTTTTSDTPTEQSIEEPQPLFSIPTAAATTMTAPAAVAPAPLFSIPSSLKKEEEPTQPQAPAPLFQIASTSSQKKEQQSRSQPAPLFAIAPSNNNPSEQQTQPSPLFPIVSTATQNDEEDEEGEPPRILPKPKPQTAPTPLFSISTSSGAPPEQQKPAPLFQIASTKQSNDATNEENEEAPPETATQTAPAPLFSINTSAPPPPQPQKPAPLFQIAPTKQTAAASAPPQQQQPAPLFQIAPPKQSTDTASQQKKSSPQAPTIPAPLFQVASMQKEEKEDHPTPPPAPLFSITGTSSSEPAPLFSIAGNKKEVQAQPQAPAPLFQIAGTTTQEKETQLQQQPATATSPLFQITPTATNASIPPPPPPTTATVVSKTALLTKSLSESKLQLQQQKQKEVQQQVQEQKDSIMEDLHIIDSSLQFINELLRNMLDVQRAAHHQLKIEKAPTDVYKDILEPVDAMLYRRGKSEVKVLVECPEDIMVSTDRLRLKQVVLNLSRNSAKFVEKGYIKLKVVVVKGKVQIWIEDTGPGIPEEKKGKLFAKFQESLDSLSQGTGLGLSLCKILIGLLDGNVYLDEKFDSGYEGRPGARFIIDLQTPPLQLDDDTESRELSSDLATNGYHLQQQQTPQPQNGAAQNGSGGSNTANKNNSIQQQGAMPQTSVSNDTTNAQRKQPQSPGAGPSLPQNLQVLFVDDDTVLRKLFVRATRRVVKGWTLTEAASGEAALRLIDEFEDGLTHFDLIFMDQYMASTEKQLLGTETTQALRSKGVKSKIVGLSANDMASDFFAAGANAFICKPLPAQQDTLREVFDELLNPEALPHSGDEEQAPGSGPTKKRQSLVFKPPPPSGDFAV